jgi:hypothetical protein
MVIISCTYNGSFMADANEGTNNFDGNLELGYGYIRDPNPQ